MSLSGHKPTSPICCNITSNSKEVGYDYPALLFPMWVSLLNNYPYVFWGITIVLTVPVIVGPLLILAHTFLEGRTVGTLGLIITDFCVLGEAYQFTTQLVV